MFISIADSCQAEVLRSWVVTSRRASEKLTTNRPCKWPWNGSSLKAPNSKWKCEIFWNHLVCEEWELLRIVCVKSHGAKCSWNLSFCISKCPLCVQECLVWSRTFLTLTSTFWPLLLSIASGIPTTSYHCLGTAPDQLGIPAVTKSSSLEHLQQDLDLWSWDLDAKDVGLWWVLKLLHWTHFGYTLDSFDCNTCGVYIYIIYNNMIYTLIDII